MLSYMALYVFPPLWPPDAPAMGYPNPLNADPIQPENSDSQVGDVRPPGAAQDPGWLA